MRFRFSNTRPASQWAVAVALAACAALGVARIHDAWKALHAAGAVGIGDRHALTASAGRDDSLGQRGQDGRLLPCASVAHVAARAHDPAIWWHAAARHGVQVTRFERAGGSAVGGQGSDAGLSIDVFGQYPQLKAVLAEWQQSHPDWVWTMLQWRQGATGDAMQLSLQAVPMTDGAWAVVAASHATGLCAKP